MGALKVTRAEREAVASAAEARRQTAIAQSVNAFLNEDLLAVARPSAARGQGKDVTMREVLDVAAERIEEASKTGGRFSGEPLVEAQIRSTLGDTYRELGEYAAAEPQVKRALELRRGALGNEHEATVRMMSMLGLIHWRQGRLDEAAPLFQNAVEISRRVLGPDHTTTLIYEMNLANVHRAKGRYQEAEPLYAHLVETQPRVRGEEHVDTLNTMGNFANLLQETGRYEQAEALRRRELEIRRRVQGDKAPGTVSTMNNLANDLALLGRYDEAEPLMQRTLELKIALYGAAHPTTLNSVDSLGTLADHMGRYAQAESLHRQSLDGRTRALGLAHERTINSRERLANTLTNQGRFAEAERLAATAAAQGTESLGPRHVSTLYPQDTRAAALLGLGRADEAEATLRRVLSILDDKKAKGEDIGEGDELSALARLHMGMALAALGRRAEAETFLIQAIPKLPPRSASTARAVRFLVDFYDDWNRAQPDADRAARATEWRQRLASTGRDRPTIVPPGSSCASSALYSCAMRYDAIVIGGGHNGLTCAAYLARAGRKTLVLERRHVLGGAAVSEEVFPGFTFSVCSYVVSLLRPEIIRDLDLPGHGLELLPLDGTFTPMANGDHLWRVNDHSKTRREIARHSKLDADAYDEYGMAMVEMGRFAKPILAMTPPDPMSLDPRGLLELLSVGRRFQKMRYHDRVNQVQLLTMSAVDFLDQWFETDVLKATMSASGIIGTFLGVRSPGTAYVLLHHYMGEIDGAFRSWGLSRGGTGTVSNAIAGAARRFGAEIRTEAPVARILHARRAGHRGGARKRRRDRRRRRRLERRPAAHLRALPRTEGAARRVPRRREALQVPRLVGQGEPGPRRPARLHVACPGRGSTCAAPSRSRRASTTWSGPTTTPSTGASRASPYIDIVIPVADRRIAGAARQARDVVLRAVHARTTWPRAPGTSSARPSATRWSTPSPSTRRTSRT